MTREAGRRLDPVTSDAPPIRLRPEIAALPAYRQGRQADGDAYKLSSNENPFPPLPSVVAALAAAAPVNRYPDASAARLRTALAERHGVDVDRVHIGAGSVSILAQLILATAGAGDEVIYAWRSFEAYPSLVTVAGATSIAVPVSADGRHDLAAMAAAVTPRTRCIIVCSPNNPTGPTVGGDEFEEFLAVVPDDVLVILDEAYAEFVTSADSVDGLGGTRRGGYLDRPNVVILRTFSKAYGLAGLRVGYGIGHARVLDAARATGIPLSVTAHAEDAALASLRAEEELSVRVRAIVERRERLVAGLRGQGWRVPDAQGNFVWLGVGEDALRVAELFDEAGIIVRPFAGDGVRISVGEEESVDIVLQVAESVVRDLREDHPVRALA